MLNWVQAAFLSVFVLSFVALICDSAREDDGSAAWSFRTRHSQGSFWTVAFSPDGRMLADDHGGEDGAVVLRAMETGVERELSGDRAGRVVCVVFSLDGSTLAAGRGDSTVSLWDVATGTKRATLRGHSARSSAWPFLPTADSWPVGATILVFESGRSPREK